MKITVDLGRNYVKSDETVFLKGSKGEDFGHHPARVKGFGRYALVEVGEYQIRRDAIVKNAEGDWTYTFRPATVGQ
jgi:hypothetical protein